MKSKNGEVFLTRLGAPIATFYDRSAVFFFHSADQAIGDLRLCRRSRVDWFFFFKRKW